LGETADFWRSFFEKTTSSVSFGECPRLRQLVLPLHFVSGSGGGDTLRDSIIIITFVGVLVGGYFSLRHRFQPEQLVKNTSSKTVSKNKIKSLGDTKHESTNYRRHEQKRLVKSRTRVTREASESDQLPDLYEREDSTEGLSLEGDSEILTSSEQPTGDTVIAGVPVGAWVRANKDKLKDFQVTAPSQQNLRVFVGCYELKKGPQTLEKDNCEKLLTAKDAKLFNERNRY
jgi:hypothetical protein